MSAASPTASPVMGNKSLEASAPRASSSTHAGEPFTLSWKKMGFSVKAKDGTKTLVDNVAGQVRSGEMLAVMGPSGAGKSTFLDLLAGRKKPSSGSILLNGSPNFDLSRGASYVEQDDALIGVLTVRETLNFSARLSLPYATKEELHERVETAIAGLGLSGVADNRIGTPIQRGISGGQKRRVTLGNGIVTGPRVLLLDEPTSGLDSTTAHEVMSTIKRMAKLAGVAVIASIHSPKWETFQLFDNVLLLAAGRTIYNGDVDGVAPYFASHGQPCPTFTNPADFMLSAVSSDFNTATSEKTSEASRMEQGLVFGDVDGWARAWEAHASARPESPDDGAQNSNVLLSQPKPRMGSLWRQTLILAERNFLNYSRNILAYGIRLAMYMGMGVLMALAWMNLPARDSAINDRLSVFFFSVAFLAFMSVAGVPSFLETRTVFMRERRNHLYGPSPFVLAETLVIMPFLFICALAFSLIVYWAIGLRGGPTAFFRFLAFLYLALLAGETQTLLIAAVAPVFVAALAIAAFANGLWMVVQGYFIRNLPKWMFYSLHWMSYQTYAFELLVDNDFQGQVFACAGSLADNTCACTFAQPMADQCAVSGDEVIRTLGYSGMSTVLYAFALVIIIAIYRFAFLGVLYLRK